MNLVDTTVFLCKLQWGPHIANLVDRHSSAAYAVRKIREICDEDTARLVYFSYFHSIYANHKDMSEFCKRQVSPSMLFGASLDDSHLNVIYYTKLNVPYSCMVTIRTEPPYVIVLVIDVISELNLRDECSKNQEPMAVYHIMPTYGGYWGPLPDHVISTHNKPNETKAYTLKTTTETTTGSIQEEQTENNTETDTQKIATWVEEFIVTKEISLMNISGNFQLEGRPIQNVEDLLDDDSDVTPKKGEDYVTSQVPLVKFSPLTQTRAQHNSYYELSYYDTREDSITMDPRLFKPRSTTHNMYHTLKLLQEKVSKAKVATNSPWQLNNTTLRKSITKTLEERTLFKQLSAENISPVIPSKDGNKAKIKEGVLVTQEIITNTNSAEHKIEALTQTSQRNPVTGVLVDRESWENIVKVAPVLATLLNSTGLPHKNNSDHSPGSSKHSKSGSVNRRKRSFQPVDFEVAEPRKLDNSIEDYRDTPDLSGYLLVYNTHNMLDNFEKTDDDMVESRKSMQNLTSNRGELIINICDLNQHQGKTQWIKVLDTSEIIVSVNNFTLNSVKIIVTPGLSLFEPKEQCLSEHVECQIEDTRVCIERTLACDGVPNCGSNSTYDEDRVSCGLEYGTRHVTVAALACLVVVLAAVYTLHYWVSRCVPKVSEGFFVYTDQSENRLLLHTVMRSPNDDYEEPETSLSGQFSIVDLSCHITESDSKEKLCKMILRKWVNCMTCNKAKKGKGLAEITSKPKNIEQIELTEKELKKIMPQKDEILQTESSLEMKTINFNDRLDEPSTNVTVKPKKDLDFIKLVNEKANILRSLELEKRILVSDSPEVLKSISEESELESTVYERKRESPVLLKSKPEPKNEQPLEINPIESIEKHLRFLENPTLIPDQPNQSDSQNFEIDYNRPSFSGIDSRRPSTNVESKESREFSRNYWKLPIGKKSKKPPKK